MMNKEKLIDLIKQKGNIYWIKNRYVRMKIELSLANITPREKDFILKYEHLNNFEYLIPYEEVTDNEEDAKWFLEFGNIERTERLHLPTFEEIEKDLKRSSYGIYTIVDDENVLLEYNKHSIKKHRCFYVYDNINGKMEMFNYKDYILACRKAKELFLGEKDE